MVVQNEFTTEGGKLHNAVKGVMVRCEPPCHLAASIECLQLHIAMVVTSLPGCIPT
jgi:hypothetical protein